MKQLARDKFKIIAKRKKKLLTANSGYNAITLTPTRLK